MRQEDSLGELDVQSPCSQKEMNATKFVLAVQQLYKKVIIQQVFN